MGSEKYPDENAFDAFIKKHGGSDNASTDCERVCLACAYPMGAGVGGDSHISRIGVLGVPIRG